MRILAFEIEQRKDPIDSSLSKEEAKKVYELFKKGVIREIYFSKKDHAAVIYFEARNISEVRKMIKTFPLVKSKYIDFKLMELIPYSGFDRLFTNPA
ncbi:MAG: hypothetical protein WBM17_13010 [Anaerolineales bacterium]